MTEKLEKIKDLQVFNQEVQEVRKVDLAVQIVNMLSEGMNQQAIANTLDLPLSSIRNVIVEYKTSFNKLQDVAIYEQVKGKLLDSLEFHLLSLMSSTEKLEKASLKTIITAFNTIHNANRLHKNLSTANTATTSVKFTGSTDTQALEKYKGN